MKNLQDEGDKDPILDEPGCDPATKPAATPVPAGYSSLSYVKCVNGAWTWVDPTVA